MNHSLKIDFTEWKQHGFQRIISVKSNRPFNMIQNPKERAMYILFSCAGYSYREIAVLFHLSRGRVQRVILKAMKTIQI